MADETFRPDKKPMPPMEQGVKISGNIPPKFRQALNQARNQSQAESAPSQARVQGSTALEDLIAGIRGQESLYTQIKLPSRGVFYDGKDGPADGVLHVRAMTGEEEIILATPRYTRKGGVAINMIFQRCLQENFKADDLLTADRTYLLIFLRGLSYGTDYEVEVRCPGCNRKFPTTINLDSDLTVNSCPEDFAPPLSGVLPSCGYEFTYRLPTGRDDNIIQEHRDRQLNMFGDRGADDTLLFRTAMLVNDIKGLKDKRELVVLLKKMAMQDVSYLRNLTTEPPFGVDTTCQITCPACMHDFEVDLPLETNFFFPKRKLGRDRPQN